MEPMLGDIFDGNCDVRHPGTLGSARMPHRVEVRFIAGLNDLLPPGRRGRPIMLEVAPGTTVKDLAESLGVPHTEIDVILVDGESVDFGRQVGDGDRVSVYPVFEALDVSPLVRLDPTPLPEPMFVLDVHLGRLARSLRLLGFDCVWRNDITDDELAAISVADQRILLTRDRGLLKRAKVTHGYLVRETDRRRQIAEVLRRFDLFGAIAPFGRCLECNGVLEPVAKEVVEHRLAPRTRRDYHDFRTCSHCGRIYWQGSHYDRLASLVEDVRRAGRAQ
jgi:uncharacterized protein with PIN domain/sulfur carrier protein ThiS